ncbi:unnamed protein product, partial [Gulo gulo]
MAGDGARDAAPRPREHPAPSQWCPEGRPGQRRLKQKQSDTEDARRCLKFGTTNSQQNTVTTFNSARQMGLCAPKGHRTCGFIPEACIKTVKTNTPYETGAALSLQRRDP